VKIFEARKSQIEERKEQKRKSSMDVKGQLEALELVISMPSGANGRLYGSVTNQTIADELAKNGFQIERKRIELIGSGFKTVGKYKATIKLYETQLAEIDITVLGQEIKTETPASRQPRRGRRDETRDVRKAPASTEETTAIAE
jgi:large subunit ribosomal protein L9